MLNQGLLNGQAPAAPVGQQPAMPQAQAPMQQQAVVDDRDYEKDPPNQEDQKLVERISIDATTIIHSKETKDKVVNVLKNSEHPIQGISNAAVNILRRIEGQAQKDGMPLNDFARVAGGSFIVSELAMVAEKSGASEKLGEEDIKIAMAQTVQDYMKEDIASGKRNPQQMQAQLEAMAPKLDQQQAAEATPTEKEDPFNPSETMSQKLNKGGLL